MPKVLLACFHVLITLGIISVEVCSSSPNNQSVHFQEEKDEMVQPNPSNVFSRKGHTLTDFMNSDKLFSTIVQTSAFQDVLSIIKNEASRVQLPSAMFNNTREVIFAFLRLDLLGTVRRVLSQRPASTWFPQSSHVSDVCYSHLMTYFEGLIGRQVSNVTSEAEGTRLISKEWALQMFDSLGKPSSGLLVGRLQLIGDYDQCMKVRATQEAPGTHSNYETGSPQIIFRGRYCRARLPMAQYIDRRLPENVNTFWLDEDHLPININWGMCVPDSCTEHDIKAFLTQGTFSTLNLPVEDVLCFNEMKLKEDPGAAFVIFLLSVLLLVVIVCTALDVIIRVRDSKPSPNSACWCLAHVTPCGDCESSRRSDTRPSSNSDHEEQQKGRDICRPQIVGTSINPDLLKETAIGDHVPSSLATNTESSKGETTTEDSQKTEKSQTPQGTHNHGFEMHEVGEKGHHTCDTSDNQYGGNHLPIQQKEDLIKDLKIEMEEKFAKDGFLKEEKAVQQDHERQADSADKSLCTHIIRGISLYTNFVELMNTDVSSSKRTIRCLEGLKAITMAWVVLGHTYTFGGIIDENNVIYDNALEMTNIPDRLAFHMGVGSAQFGVDTFFVICGCLVMFISLDKLKSVKQSWKFWACFIFRRFWRLTPIYMVVLAIGTTLYDHIVYGPLKAHNLEEFYECREKWWAHLLYINNFYRPTQKCMTWTWYLAVDMQLHVLSPLLIYPVYRNRSLGCTMIVCLLVAGMVSAFFSELTYGGQFLLMDMNFSTYWSHVYTMPWTRVSAFAIGLLLGVLLRDLDSRPLPWEKFLARTWCQRLFTPMMWTLSIAVAVCLSLINHAQWRHGSAHWGNTSLAVLESLSRPLWSLAVAWVILACNTGRAGPIANILSFPPFVTLSRLSYSVYLLHPLIILFVVYSRRTAIYLPPDRIDQVYNYLGHLTLTHLFAMALYLCVEAPLRSLDLLWEPRRPHKTA